MVLCSCRAFRTAFSLMIGPCNSLKMYDYCVIPHHQGTSDELEEERRLLFVSSYFALFLTGRWR